MVQQNNYIVYLCYGKEGTLHECAYSLLSLSRLYTPEELANTEIWIYTDDPAYFRAFSGCRLPLYFRALDADVLKEWRGSINFPHRVKLEVLREMEADRTGNIFYLDSDTVFTRRVDDVLTGISNGELYMHVKEGIVSDRENPMFDKLASHLEKNEAKLNGRDVSSMAMWNAGMIGFDTKYRYLVDKALAYTDTEYPKFSKHIMEQFALSVVFQQEAGIKAAAPYILHYWNLKEARGVLASFFAYFKDKSWDELVHYSQLVQMHVLLQEKISFLNNRGLMQALLKRQWLPPEHNWAVLKKEL